MMSVRFKPLLTALLATLIAVPLHAEDRVFKARNHMTVAELDNGLIEVGGFIRNSGLEDYWCAVGDYLYRAKRLPWEQKIYVARGLGPGQVTAHRDAVLFTLDPAAAGIKPLDKSFRVVGTLTVGRSKQVNSAFYSCRQFPLRDRD
ncbi:hypothetical protein GFB49_10590 [Epibacterium sp. SM1979]|uniref:Uncharacterized protein n=1 Tax=Tritonibacter litoralis TaxID=2662264 RepID=A0A843YI10_9RHOB|nr:hypothetical protein [Tritonibacter litoralis]MQQ08902.1 hypothetical protein [Tritonibacter litoralis]